MPKEELNKHLFYTVKLISLTRRDLDFLVDKLREFGDLRFEIGGSRFHSLDEIKEEFGHIVRNNELTIKIMKSGEFIDFKLQISGNYVTLFIDENIKEEMQVGFYEIKNFLENKNKHKFFMFLEKIALTKWFTLGMILILFSFDFIGIPIEYEFSYAFFLLVWVYFLLMIYRYENYFFPLRLGYEGSSTFWSRNKDQIILLFIGSIFGATTTLILTKLFL